MNVILHMHTHMHSQIVSRHEYHIVFFKFKHILAVVLERPEVEVKTFVVFIPVVVLKAAVYERQHQNHFYNKLFDKKNSLYYFV